jgi:3-oxoacyl-[acyl-carrier-protein] synthase-1
MVILEEEEHAKKRGAKILAKLSGYFANSDGYDMVAPSGEGALRCMEGAIKQSNVKIDYINTHGTSTPVGDAAELNAIKQLFNSDAPMISSTKSMTGHSLGATGAHEAIYSIIMINENFIAPSINIESLCEEAKGLDVVTETKEATIENILSNSFGFGGTNASLVISRY